MLDLNAISSMDCGSVCVCGLFMLEGFVNRFWNAKQLSPLFRYTETVLSVSQSDFNFNGKTDSHINPIEKKEKIESNQMAVGICRHLLCVL